MSDPLLATAKVVLALALVVLGVRYVRIAAVANRPAPRVSFPQPVVAVVEKGIYATDPEKRIEAFRELERAASEDPLRRQKFVDQVLAQLHYRMCGTPDWQTRLWALVLPHLRPGDAGFWPGIDLRVERGVLKHVNLSGLQVRHAVFERVRFVGDALFIRTVFTGDVTFEGSCFAKHVRFKEGEFRGAAGFDHVTFTGTASFPGVTVAGPASFHEARFSALTDFTGTRFAGPFTAIHAGFAGRTWFRDAHFAARTRFAGARFTGHADFAGSSFVDDPGLGCALARTDWYAVRAWPAGWTLDAHERELPKRPGRWAELTR